MTAIQLEVPEVYTRVHKARECKEAIEGYKWMGKHGKDVQKRFYQRIAIKKSPYISLLPLEREDHPNPYR